MRETFAYIHNIVAKITRHGAKFWRTNAIKCVTLALNRETFVLCKRISNQMNISSILYDLVKLAMDNKYPNKPHPQPPPENLFFWIHACIHTGV